MNEEKQTKIHYAKGVTPLKEQYTLKDFTPLITVAIVVTFLSFVVMFLTDGGWMMFMRVFMAGFFLIFGGLKLLKLSHFATAYGKYDLIAKHSRTYALIYPFLEIGLGLGYAFNIYPVAVNMITLMLMSVSALGVLRVLVRGEKIVCACMGAVFKIPMTGVTLGENLFMVLMAVGMLFML